MSSESENLTKLSIEKLNKIKANRLMNRASISTRNKKHNKKAVYSDNIVVDSDIDDANKQTRRNDGNRVVSSLPFDHQAESDAPQILQTDNCYPAVNNVCDDYIHRRRHAWSRIRNIKSLPVNMINIDEAYNQLHDRIRILEQQEKILNRGFLPWEANKENISKEYSYATYFTRTKEQLVTGYERTASETEPNRAVHKKKHPAPASRCESSSSEKERLLAPSPIAKRCRGKCKKRRVRSEAKSERIEQVRTSTTNVNGDNRKVIEVVVNVVTNGQVDVERKTENEKITGTKCSVSGVPHWRTIFDNAPDRLTESSYASPAEAASLDISYYVQKLLHMSPDSIRNLDVSESFDLSDKCVQVTPRAESVQTQTHYEEQRNECKMPLYGDSFDDGSLWLNSKRQDSNTVIQEETLQKNPSLVSESVQFSMSDYIKKYVSSLSDERNNKSKTEDIDDKYEQKSSDHTDDKDADIRSAAESRKISDEEYFSFPSMEELLKRGVISKPFNYSKLKEPAVSMDEEELSRLLLEIEGSSMDLGKTMSANELSVEFRKLEISSNGVPSVMSNSSSSIDLKKEFRLLGLSWIDTTIQRTLDATAMNSSSTDVDRGSFLGSSTEHMKNIIFGKP